MTRCAFCACTLRTDLDRQLHRCPPQIRPKLPTQAEVDALMDEIVPDPGQPRAYAISEAGRSARVAANRRPRTLSSRQKQAASMRVYWEQRRARMAGRRGYG